MTGKRYLLSLFIFILIIVAYVISPALLVHKYLIPIEKKQLFSEARKWSEESKKRKLQEEKHYQTILQDLKLTQEEKTAKIGTLKRKSMELKHEKGAEFHQRLINMGITLDFPILIASYFLLGMILLFAYRFKAQRAATGKLLYTLYLLVISLLLIITTFGFGYTCTYVYSPEFWKIQDPFNHAFTFLKDNPLRMTPFIAGHFVLFALNAAVMGPFDVYMTVKPYSLQISLMQWLERVFVICVLFRSIYGIWVIKPEEREEELEE